jgi:L-xylulokinase
VGSYLLGLDVGNTVTKAVLFDTTGRQVGFHALDGATHKPAPGMVERSVPELWENAKTAIRSCMEAAKVSSRDILAIGCAGHGNGLYLLDKTNEPLLGIQSLDSRAAKLAEELDHAQGSAMHAISLQRPWPSQTPVLLAWMKRHRPDLYARAGTVVFAKDILTWNLTGRRVSEISDMSGAGMLRLPPLTYSPELLAMYGLEDAAGLFPELIEPAQIAGHVTETAAMATGLAAGTPVIAGYFDVVSSAMGSGVVRPGEASIVAGSWSINQVFSAAPVVDERVFMVSAFAPGCFVNMENSATSAANLEWYVRTFIERGRHGSEPFNFVNDAVGQTKPSLEDPLFHPFIYGGRMGAHQRGGFYGLAGWHDEGNILRALFEGVMFEHRRHVEVLAEAGVTFQRAALSGGGARSPHWPQIFADGLDVTVTVAEVQETGALGAVMGAAIAIGLYADYNSAVSAMSRPKSTFVPNSAMRQHYDRRYARWTRLTAAMEPIWLELSPT